MNNGKSGSRKTQSNRGGKPKSGGAKPFQKRASQGQGTAKPFQKRASEGQGTAKPKPSNRTFDKKPKVVSTPNAENGEMRLNKYISNSGVCSRRDADLYIVSGNVKVNGEIVTELGHKVKITDVVNFDGMVITPEKKVYIVLNKPKGFSTINEEIVSQENVLSLVKNASKTPLAPVGRMDKSTLGLMIFTNDTNLIQKLSSTEQRSSKMYQVSLDKNLKYEDLERVKKGIYIEERRVFVEDVAYVENQPKTEIGIKLKASNVKLVRALFESLDYNVIKVDRVMYGTITKWNLPRGSWRDLTEEEIRFLQHG
ncbi:pseudouridine synthase [Myroides odoratus]|uniref:pseudouridine synthase n=1 Tax=Myroides odoratus TaxID=256 RepID=UPI0039AF1565